MKKYVYYDSKKPDTNLVYVISDSDIDLVKVELEVEDGEDIVAKLKEILRKESE